MGFLEILKVKMINGHRWKEGGKLKGVKDVEYFSIINFSKKFVSKYLFF